jgi:glycosyltransferase involved in cell wall biosynthesis
MKNPFVSVIIPTYNRKELCKRAVLSVLNQSYSNYELIVVNDASDDGTYAEDFFNNTDVNAIYLCNQVNRGVSYSRNFGVSHAKGEWIAFLDSDDEWHRKKLEKQVHWIQQNPTYNVVQTKEIWIRNGIRVNPPLTHEKRADYIFKESLERCMITPSSVMIRKDFFIETGGFNESLPACEDYDLWLRITLHHPVGLVKEYLLTRYGGYDDQLSSTVEVLDRFRIRALLNLLEHEKPDKNQKELIMRTLAKKADIVASGLKKRDRMDEYERYRKIADEYTGCI